MDRVLVRCDACGQPYTVRTDGDRYLVPTPDQRCRRCGEGAFSPVGSGALGVAEE